jgi:hypothetical protein
MFRIPKRRMSKSVFKSAPRRLALIAALLLAACGPLAAEYFIIRDYGVVVRINPDGRLLFTETIEVEFTEPRHGIFRAIPLVNRIGGKRHQLIIEDIRVDGHTFERGRENNNLVLKIGDPDRYVEGRQTYLIRYEVANGLNFFKDHVEFYWDLLGVGWEVLVERFHFEVTLPPGLPLTEDDVRLYTGAAGSTGREAQLSVYASAPTPTITGHTERIFQPGEAVTLAVRLPLSAFPKPDETSIWLRLHGLLLLPAALLSGVLFLIGRSRNRRQAIMVEFMPPTDISPAVAGGFIDHEVENHDILSLVPLLAYKKYLRLEVEDEKRLWLFHHRNLRFVRLPAPDGVLPDFERTFLDSLFASGEEVELDSLKDRFYTHMNTIRDQVKAWIDSREWYEPDQARYRLLVFGAALVTGLAGVWALKRDNPDAWWILGAAALMVFLTRFFRRRNLAGNEIYKKLEGFRRFVVKAERPVLERLLRDDPLYFDKTLPYAVAFGEVKRWTRQFDGLLSEPPSWYYSPGRMAGQNFDWGTFQSNFSEEINDIGSVFGSSPSSSSSGGGGSSGGGSGGGGGGSW